MTQNSKRNLRVALVGAEREENLSLRALASALIAAGHEPIIVAFDAEEELPQVVRRVTSAQFDVVGLSVAFQHRAREMLDLADALRSAGFIGHICCGGHTATAAWRELLSDCAAVDTVVRHDGEITFPALLEVLHRREAWLEVPGVCARDAAGDPAAAPPRAQPEDLDALPWPLRDRPHALHAGLRFAPIWGSRGCWGNCSYCCINSWHRAAEGRRLRFRTPGSIAEEMAQLYHQRDVRIFCFHDDNFFLPRARDTVERLGAIRRELDTRHVGKLGIVGKCRPDGLDAPMLRAVQQMGVFRLYLGIENGSDAGLLHLGRRHDGACARRALSLFRETGMFACFNVLLFEPWGRLPDLFENLELLRTTSDIPSNFCRAEVYAGTALESALRQEGRLRGSYLGYTYEILDERAELAFRLSAICFAQRNFAAQGVANTATGLGYEGAVLRHFFGAPAEPLAREVDALTREVNEDTISRLETLLRFAEQCDPRDESRACDFAEELATAINLRDLDLGARQEDLRERLRSFGNEASSEVGRRE